MKILVPVKRVVDYNVKVRAKSDESGPDLSNAKMAINPFCEIAIEEAVRIKEAGNAEEVGCGICWRFSFSRTTKNLSSSRS
jgi:electron transfer flavoprotein beta subunit